MNGWHFCYVKNCNERMVRFIQDGVAYLANPNDIPDEQERDYAITHDWFTRGPVTQYDRVEAIEFVPVV